MILLLDMSMRASPGVAKEFVPLQPQWSLNCVLRAEPTCTELCLILIHKTRVKKTSLKAEMKTKQNICQGFASISPCIPIGSRRLQELTFTRSLEKATHFAQAKRSNISTIVTYP